MKKMDAIEIPSDIKFYYFVSINVYLHSGSLRVYCSRGFESKDTLVVPYTRRCVTWFLSLVLGPGLSCDSKTQSWTLALMLGACGL